MASPSPRFVVAALAAAVLVAAATPAGALDIGDVDLKLFPASGANTGFTNAGPDHDFAIHPGMQMVCTGAGVFQAVASCAGHSGYEITITQDLQTVHQFPQARNAEPTAAAPFIADSQWTATNTSGDVYKHVLLLFTAVNLAPYPGAIAPGGYPDLVVGLDGNLLDIVKYTALGSDYFFGAVDLGRLEPGQSRQFTVRYIVSSGGMPIVNNQVVMPPLKLLSVVVPEPGTIGLLLTGLAGIALIGRAR